MKRNQTPHLSPKEGQDGDGAPGPLFCDIWVSAFLVVFAAENLLRLAELSGRIPRRRVKWILQQLCEKWRRERLPSASWHSRAAQQLTTGRQEVPSRQTFW